MKKIFTHKYTIYKDGWQFKWEKKSDDEMLYTIDGRDIIILMLFVMYVI